MLINVILWLIFGGIAGWLASMIMGREAQMGALANIVVGIIGAIVGGFIVSLFNVDVTTFSIPGLLVAVLGAVVLLAVLSSLRRAA